MMSEPSETADPSIIQSDEAAEENLSFIRNFNDIFLAIGLGVFAFGLALATSLMVVPTASAWLISIANFGCAAIMWFLAEVFARKRRLFMPAIVILLAFSFFTLAGTVAAYVALNIGGFESLDVASWDQIEDKIKAAPLTIMGVQTAAILAYYVRMKLPFAIGLGALSLGMTAAYSFHAYKPEGFDPDQLEAIGFGSALAIGVFMFFLGVFYDAKDPQRVTRFADNGFWLHFFAAPLIFWSALQLVVGGRDAAAAGSLASVTTLGLVFGFAIISLLINRRALLVSGLLAAAFAIGGLVSDAGLDGKWTLAITLLLLGGSMVLLGGGWHSVRRFIIAPFPKSGPIARIIPPQTIGA